MLGQLLKFKGPPARTVRIVSILRDETAYLYEIVAGRRFVFPEATTVIEIREAIRLEEAEVLADDPYLSSYPPLPSGKRTNAQVETERNKSDRQERALKVVNWILERVGEGIYKEGVYLLVTLDASKEFNTCHQTVRRWMNRWWRGGMVPVALRPDYRAVGLVKAPDGEKPGPKSRPGAPGMKMTPEIRAKLRQYWDDNLERGLSHEVMYEEILERHFSAGVKSVDANTGVKHIRLVPPSQQISFDQYLYYYYRDRKEVADSKRTHGETRYNQNHRAVTSSSIAVTDGPFSKVEVDFTVASMFVVGRKNRAQILGKPVLGYAVDVYTGAVVGMIVSLERSTEMLLRLLFQNILMDKVKYCARYGVDIKPEDWPMCHIPKVIVCDRGEGRGKIGDHFTQNFGVVWKNLPRMRPDLKPSVESKFAYTDRKTKFQAGWEPQYWKRGDKKVIKDAQYDLDEFTEIIIRIMLAHLKAPSHEKRPENAEAKAAGQGTSPLELWNFGLESVSGLLRRETNPNILKLKILPETSVSISGAGLLFNTLTYVSAALGDPIAAARRAGRRSLTISYDPDLVDEVWYRPDPTRSEFVAIPLEAQWAHYKGFSFAELDVQREQEADDRAMKEVERKEKSINLRRDIQAVDARALKKTLQHKKAAGLGRKGYIAKNIRLEREKEAAERVKEGQNGRPPEVVPPPAPKSQPAPATVRRSLFVINPNSQKYLKEFENS